MFVCSKTFFNFQFTVNSAQHVNRWSYVRQFNDLRASTPGIVYRNKFDARKARVLRATFPRIKKNGKQSAFSRTHPRQRHRRESLPRELRLFTRIPVTLTREDPRRCKGTHPHTVTNEEDNAARHPSRRRRAADAATRCLPDPRFDRPRRRFIPDFPFYEQTGPIYIKHERCNRIGDIVTIEMKHRPGYHRT